MAIVKCKTCGETDLLPSDICGECCIYCAGSQEYHKRRNEWLKKNDMSCIECGEIQKDLTNDKCPACYKLWQECKLKWQQEDN